MHCYKKERGFHIFTFHGDSWMHWVEKGEIPYLCEGFYFRTYVIVVLTLLCFIAKWLHVIPIRNGWIQCPFLALMEQLVQISLTKNRPENIPPPQKRSSCSNHFLSSNSFPELSELSYTSWRCNYCDAQIQLHPTKPSFVLKVDRVIHCAVVGPLSDARHKRDVIIFHDKRGQERDPNWPVLGGLLVVTL